MLEFKKDPEFGDIVDFETMRPMLKDTYDKLLPEFNILASLQVGSRNFNDEPSNMVAAGASMLAWMMMVAAEEYELAEELKAGDGPGNIFTLGWTEEHAGSDLLSVKTQATPMSDDPNEKQYYLKGGKWLINNSYHADYHMVVAKIDPNQDGPRSLSIFAVPRSSTKNWERLETHLLQNMVLTKFDIDGPGTLVGKPGHGLTIIQRMAMPSKFQCSYMGMRMVQHAIPAAIDHLSTKTIFKEQPLNFSNVFRQMYRLTLQTSFMQFLFHRALVFSDSSFLQFHGVMLKSWLLLRTNEILSQNLLVTGSKGFLKESIIGRDAYDSFVLPVFDGHYTINTLMQAKHMSRYLNATDKADMNARINRLREKLFLAEPGNQINRKPSEIRRPAFFDYVDYIDQIGLPFDLGAAEVLDRVRQLMKEFEDRELTADPDYKYKTGVIVQWLEAILAACEFWKVTGDDNHLNVIVQVYNDFVKAFNDIISEGALDTPFLQFLRHQYMPQTDDNEAFLRGLVSIQPFIESLRQPAMGD